MENGLRRHVNNISSFDREKPNYGKFDNIKKITTDVE